MTYGIKVSKQGEDVKICSNDKLLLNSEQECLKVSYRKIDTISIPHLTDTTYEYQYARYYKDFYHGLGFVPIVRLFEKIENEIIEAPSQYQERETAGGPFIGFGYQLVAQADSSKVRVEVQIYYIGCDVPATNINFILFIFANKIE